jgi:2,5-diamino-6-(ribosylamino)-4(3H)-pyrimidinone 5'-phosphate reductase
MVDHTKPDYVSLEFPDPPDGRPYVFVNMVMSTDGKVVIDGTEQGLGTAIDQRLMRELRVSADVVLNGAETLRKSGTSSRLNDPTLASVRAQRELSPNPIAAVLTASGNVPLDAVFFTSDEFDAVVYLGDEAGPEVAEAIRETGRQVVEVPVGDPAPTMLRHMHDELGARYVLCEGGPTLNGVLLDAGMVDEYFLTLGPRLVSGDATLTPFRAKRPTSSEFVTQLDLVSAVPNPATGEVYLRYRRQAR